ncbi:U3 small nucleolar RNA-associated protein 4 homolog isoform X2 [Orussus abietinus]|uniref:U3 small nucleolar RNA-associated protein 4 homolog isoform X2 n=1 Tax=Orussus abietinus TaxID=222816 RepID=UPI0006253561|nr:U3 small nucleolar RNA-associated protein 4 homolog isoform X2 [Orussus abietinus]
MSTCKIHNVRFYNLEPRAATCLTYERRHKKLALSRNDNSIEIWNVANAPFLENTIPGHPEGCVETVLWVGSRLFSTGLSGMIMEYDLTQLGIKAETAVTGGAAWCMSVNRENTRLAIGKAHWVKGIERRLHTHDVRALVEANGKLYSAGVDGYLAQSSYPPKMLVKYPPLLQPPCVTVCKKSRCILLRYTNYLELWKLASTSKTSQNSSHVQTTHWLGEEPIKLLQLKTKGDEPIISCAINKDSKTIVYSTDTHVRVFNFDVIDGDAQLARNDIDLTLPRVQKMLFSPNGKLFVAINNDGNGNTIVFFRVEKKLLWLAGSVRTPKDSMDNIGLMCFSPDSGYLLCADQRSRIVVYKIDRELSTESIQSWYLPKYNCAPTAIAVQKSTLNLVIVYSDHKILEYNIPKRQFTEFSNNLESRLPHQWLARPFPVTNVTFDPNNENVIILHDDTTVYVIDKNKSLPRNEAKIPKLENGESTEDSSSGSYSQSQHAFHMAKKYKHLVHLAWLNDSEMVAVEVDPTSLIEKLPPTLKQKYYGM